MTKKQVKPQAAQHSEAVWDIQFVHTVALAPPGENLFAPHCVQFPVVGEPANPARQAAHCGPVVPPPQPLHTPLVASQGKLLWLLQLHAEEEEKNKHISTPRNLAL